MIDAFDDLPDLAPGRPVWLVTLADLALLLVGFFVLVQATQLDRRALANGLREGFGVRGFGVRGFGVRGFGVRGFGVRTLAEPMAVSAGAADGFATGSAVLPGTLDALIDWARSAVRDRRVTLRLAGSVDGTPGDRDGPTGSGAVLAGDRTRAVAVALIAAGLPADRMTLATAARPGRRGVTVTMHYAGDRP